MAIFVILSDTVKLFYLDYASSHLMNLMISLVSIYTFIKTFFVSYIPVSGLFYYFSSAVDTSIVII